jgi:hypothetical protein
LPAGVWPVVACHRQPYGRNYSHLAGHFSSKKRSSSSPGSPGTSPVRHLQLILTVARRDFSFFAYLVELKDACAKTGTSASTVLGEHLSAI